MVVTFDEPFPLPDGTTVPRTLRVYLPDSYWESDERYPVTYFFDGQLAMPERVTPTKPTPATVAAKTAPASSVDAPKRKVALTPAPSPAPVPNHAPTRRRDLGLEEFLGTWCKQMVLVGIPSPPDEFDRMDEYCPWPSVIRGHAVRPRGADVVDWVADVVKPHVDARFRTWSHREATAIAGFSLGGMMSCYAIAARNDAFSKAGCLSPCVRTWERQLRREIADAAHEKRMSPDTRVFLSFGSRECGRKPRGTDPARASDESRAMDRLAWAIHEVDARSRVACQRGGRHRMGDWARLVPQLMGFLWLNE